MEFASLHLKYFFSLRGNLYYNVHTVDGGTSGRVLKRLTTASAGTQAHNLLPKVRFRQPQSFFLTDEGHL